ncbi:MAG: hypothetical protein HN904_20380, partial [Victivallales bacterium]|nr:hypothetical protein [Victivallales bacterium]
TVTVDDAANIKTGAFYLLQVKDDKLGGEFWQHLHARKVRNWLKMVKWADAGHASLFKVVAVEGNQVTLREPLRFDIRPPWRVSLKRHGNISECGIESLRFEFPADVQPAKHLREPGYNAVRFKSAHDCWIKDVTIANSDNGVTCSYMSSHIEIRDAKLVGRRGHHGISLSNATNCLIVDLVDDCREPWTHTITMDHKASGNVHKGTMGTNTVSLDFHRDAPYENLHTNIRAKWNYNSSGDPKAGPHCAARNTYWGLSGKAVEAANPNGQGMRDFLYRHWGKIQTNVVTGLAVPERFSEDEEWYEDLPNLLPRDLHQAQLERRLKRK